MKIKNKIFQALKRRKGELDHGCEKGTEKCSQRGEPITIYFVFYYTTKEVFYAVNYM